MSDINAQIGLFGYAASAVTYLGLSAFLLRGWTKHLERTLFCAAYLATAVFAGITAYGYLTGVDLVSWGPHIDHLRQGLWIALLWALLHPELANTDRMERPSGQVMLRTGLLLALWVVLGAFEFTPRLFGPQVQLLARLILVTVGLVLIENLVRRTAPEALWSVKFFCIGLGGIFAYELFITAEGFLFQGTNPALEAARGTVYLLASPILGIAAWRLGKRDFDLAISPSTAFYTGTLIASGIYLCLMAVGAVFVRRLGGEGGIAFQAIFLVGTIGLLSVFLSSGSVRSRLKLFISRQFFQYKYDYRREWLRFTETLSEDNPAFPIETRVIIAIADVLDSPAGAMWFRQDDRFALASAWNLTAVSLESAESEPLVRFLETTQSVIDIPEYIGGAETYEGFSLPHHLVEIERSWLIVPMFHDEILVGIVLIARSRTLRDLDWEDLDLLKTLGRHAASYIAELNAGRALAEVREFEKINRRFAFALHDLKNLVSRLSLLSSNFEKHGENPEFRKDMVGTLVTTTDEMKRLMHRLQSDQLAVDVAPSVNIYPMLEELVDLDGTTASINCEDDSMNIAVVADRDRLLTVFRHLFQNAAEAIPEMGGWVRLHLHQHARSAIVEVIDNGCGMDKAFIENELFRPFSSTKKGGFGLGAYQCRDYVRELGGDLEIISAPGAGTTVRVTLPVADMPAGAHRPTTETS